VGSQQTCFLLCLLGFHAGLGEVELYKFLEGENRLPNNCRWETVHVLATHQSEQEEEGDNADKDDSHSS